VFIDPDLLQYDEVWAAAGTWNDVFAVAPATLARVTDGVVIELRREQP
jgi:prolyl-tRNA editing enzyme YbaK/EbsC (Cys-tRNA(Pro) deacylase)